MQRREVLRLTLVTGALGGLTRAAQANPACPTDGTPGQFVPKAPPDPRPLDNELRKYLKCPYCGMDRTQFHHARVLVHYGDDLVDATCSLHCAAISLSLNIDREPKAVYVSDNAAPGPVKPLIEVDKAIFLIGSSMPGVMTKRSKVAYGREEAAKAAQATHGGELGSFEKALTAAYTDMAQDVAQIRKSREERRKRAAQPKHG